MGHFNKNHGGSRQQQGGRGARGGNALRLPEAFDKGELIKGLVFSTVPSRDGGSFVAAILTDGTAVEPGSYNEYRFNPVLDEKEYYCSVMGGNGKWSALPVYHRELSTDEWVREQPQRTCMTAVLVFQMSDEHHTGREPRPISRHFDGRTVLVERGYEDRVQLGKETRVSLIEPPNARNILFAIPLVAAPAAKPVQPKDDVQPLPPPEQPADQLFVSVRFFEARQGILVVRSVADVKFVDRRTSIYEVLSDGNLGVRTTPETRAKDIRANANRIVRALEASLEKAPKIVKQNIMARIDAMDAAVPRALAALGVQDVKTGRVAQAKASGKPEVVRPQGAATIGDAVGKVLIAKGVEDAPPASPPTVAPEPEVSAWKAVDPFDNGHVDAPIESTASADTDVGEVADADDVIVAPETLLQGATEYSEEDAALAAAGYPVEDRKQILGRLPVMAKSLGVTVEVLRRAVAVSELNVLDFSERLPNLQRHYVRQAKAEKSA